MPAAIDLDAEPILAAVPPPPPQEEMTTEPSRRSASHDFACARIEVKDGPDAGRLIDITDEDIRIGTALDNHIALTDRSVSRHHCQLVPSADGLWVRDLDSTNGTFLNGVRITHAIVTLPATMQIGDTKFALTAIDEAVSGVRKLRDRFGRLLGRSPRMLELYADLDAIAASELTVLIEGETGTGKDVVAESIHRASHRASRPYV